MQSPLSPDLHVPCDSKVLKVSLGKWASVMFALALENVKWEPNKGVILMWRMPHAILYWRSKRTLCKNSAAQCGPAWVWNKFPWAGSQVLHRIFVIYIFLFWTIFNIHKRGQSSVMKLCGSTQAQQPSFRGCPPHPYPGTLWKLVKPLSCGVSLQMVKTHLSVAFETSRILPSPPWQWKLQSWQPQGRRTYFLWASLNLSLSLMSEHTLVPSWIGVHSFDQLTEGVCQSSTQVSQG